MKTITNFVTLLLSATQWLLMVTIFPANMLTQTTFGEENIVCEFINGINFIHTTDLDNDGDMDVSASVSNDKIAWYENLLPPISIEPTNPTSQTPKIFPNLTDNILHITLPTTQPTTFTLHNTLGQILLQEETNASQHSISIEHLSAGLYYLQVNGVCFKVVKR